MLEGRGLTVRRGQGPGDLRCAGEYLPGWESDLSGYERTPSPWCCARYRAGWEGWWHWPGLAVRWDCPSSATQTWNFEFSFSDPTADFIVDWRRPIHVCVVCLCICMLHVALLLLPSHLRESGQTPRRSRMPMWSPQSPRGPCHVEGHFYQIFLACSIKV